jgi:precorrin-3B C17-methyltransferase
VAHKLYIVSSGAGGTKYMTTEALHALQTCDRIVGYRNYLKELESVIGDTPLFMSGMTKEAARCQEAIDYAKEGYTTCIVSNGDINVFGIATRIVALIDAQDLWHKIEVEFIAGVTSFLAAASRVGAPVGEDFALISLSDKRKESDLIDKRIRLGLEGDFVLGIYNPKSKKHFQPYLHFLRRLATIEDRIIIVASHIGRKKEKVTITTSQELVAQGLEHPDITMSTLIIVCNSHTRRTRNGLLLTADRSLK